MVRFIPGARDYNDLICKTDYNFSKAIWTLLADFAVGGLLSSVTYMLLLRLGEFTPFRTLRGLLTHHLRAMVFTYCGCLMYFLWMQHSHVGMDFSFRFRWLRE